MDNFDFVMTRSSATHPLADFVNGEVSAWAILLAVAVSVAAWVVSRGVRKGVAALLLRTPFVGASGAAIAARIAQYAVVLLGVGIGLAFLGANVQPLLAIALVVGVVVVLVLRGVADNFAAGVLLQTRQPVKVGDLVEVGVTGRRTPGVIAELNARAVVLYSLDGRTIRIPNLMFIQDPIVNLTERRACRSMVEVRVARRRGTSIEDQLASVENAIAQASGVNAAPPAKALAVTASPTRLIMRVTFWHDPHNAVDTTASVVLAVAVMLEHHSVTGTVTSVLTDPPLTAADTI